MMILWASDPKVGNMVSRDGARKSSRTDMGRLIPSKRSEAIIFSHSEVQKKSFPQSLKQPTFKSVVTNIHFYNCHKLFIIFCCNWNKFHQILVESFRFPIFLYHVCDSHDHIITECIKLIHVNINKENEGSPTFINFIIAYSNTWPIIIMLEISTHI